MLNYPNAETASNNTLVVTREVKISNTFSRMKNAQTLACSNSPVATYNLHKKNPFFL